MEFLDEKVLSATRTFSDVIVSKTLTIATLKTIAKGMKQRDVERLLDSDVGSKHHRSAKDAQGRDVQVCEWEEGRVLRVYIKAGKVSGAVYLESLK